MNNHLLKYKKDELLQMCKNCNKKVNSSNTKSELSRNFNKTYYESNRWKNFINVKKE